MTSRPEPDRETGERLQKVLAAAGVGSRRACEVIIGEGRVEVDGQLVTEQGRRVDPATAVIKVDGMRIATAPDHVYLALNKPRGVLSTMSDDQGRPHVGEYMTQRKDRIYHVGRLDADSEGLLLFTNDGELAHRLMHPSWEVHKTYLAEVLGPVEKGVGRRLRAGVELEDGPVKVDSFKLISAYANRVLVEVVLHEGRKHVVRRLLEEVGHPVERLVRTRIGPVHLGDQRAGKMRPLNSREIAELYDAVGL